MNTVKKIVIVAVVWILSIAATFYIARSTGGVAIEKKTPIKQRTVFVAKNCDDYKKCYDSDIFIHDILSDNRLTIQCGNECKTAERSYKMRAPTSFDKNIIMAGVMLNVTTAGKITPQYGGEYYRYLFQHVGAGGGFYGSSTMYTGKIGVLVSF